VVDDGSTSQLIIELDKSIDSTPVHVFTEDTNITDLKIISRKIPTIVIVNGLNKVKGTFVHESAMEANDRNYLEVKNENLKSPAECKDFAAKIFRANIETQYEYGLDTFEGITLVENDIIRIDTEDELFAGNYRVRGKKIAFSKSSFTIGLNINRKPPTLAEYIIQQDN
jgi:CRISPR/Cas system CMR-associated protein Cmr5 small subunit